MEEKSFLSLNITLMLFYTYGSVLFFSEALHDPALSHPYVSPYILLRAVLPWLNMMRLIQESLPERRDALIQHKSYWWCVFHILVGVLVAHSC